MADSFQFELSRSRLGSRQDSPTHWSQARHGGGGRTGYPRDIGGRIRSEASCRRCTPIRSPRFSFAWSSKDFTRKDLEPLIGSRARVSEVMTRRRSLTLAMIRRVRTTDGPNPPNERKPGEGREQRATARKELASRPMY